MSSPGSAQKSTTKVNFSPSFFYDGFKDHTSLDELVNKLISSHKNVVQVQKSSPCNLKYKQASISTYCLSSSKHDALFENGTPTKASTNFKINKENQASNKKQVLSKTISRDKISKNIKSNSSTHFLKLDEWITKNSSKVTENNVSVEKTEDVVKNKKEALVENSNCNKQPVKEGRQLKRQSSGSFAKYGMCLPSFEDIVAYQKKLDDDKKYVDSINMIEDSQESLELNIDEPEVPVVILDCKHLTENEIDEAYKHNSQYIYEVFHGMRYSVRHQKFKKQNYQDQFTIQDLKYNTSTVSFTYDQKQQLLRRLHKQFDSEDGLSNQYFFKVLLPELCLKIFMDTHNMSFDEATTYLGNRPVVVY